MPRDYVLKVQSPIHIGTGHSIGSDRILLRDDTVYVPDLEAYFQDHPDELDDFVRGAENGEPVSEYLPALPQYSRYTLSIPPGSDYRSRPKRINNEIETTVKDSEGQPYIPGSTVKGAIRMALAHRALSESATDVTADDLIRELKTDSDDRSPIESMFRLGDRSGRVSDAQRDVLRCLAVEDSTSAHQNNLSLRNVHVYELNGDGIRETQWSRNVSPFETIEPTAKMRTTISVDIQKLNRMADRFDGEDQLKALFGSERTESAILDTVETALRNLASDIAQRDANLFVEFDGIRRFCDDLSGALYLRLGAATGFHTKTALLGLDSVQQVRMERAAISNEFDNATPPKHDGCKHDGKVKFNKQEDDTDTEFGSLRSSSYETKYTPNLSSSSDGGQGSPLQCEACGEHLSVEDGDVSFRFPKIRRVVHEQGDPKYPFGWVELDPS